MDCWNKLVFLKGVHFFEMSACVASLARAGISGGRLAGATDDLHDTRRDLVRHGNCRTPPRCYVAIRQLNAFRPGDRRAVC